MKKECRVHSCPYFAIVGNESCCFRSGKKVILNYNSECLEQTIKEDEKRRNESNK